MKDIQIDKEENTFKIEILEYSTFELMRNSVSIDTLSVTGSVELTLDQTVTGKSETFQSQIDLARLLYAT